MPSRRYQMKATEERKKRQEKFRKRTKSLFSKTRLLAKDTDAWVSLVVRDRGGRVQSFRSSGQHHWPPSIGDLMTTHPSGTHEFLEKHAVSGCWKELVDDESDTGMVDSDAGPVDGDAGPVDGGVPTIDMVPVEKEAEIDCTIDQCYVGVDAEDRADGANAPRDDPDEAIAAENSAVDPLGEVDDTPPLQLENLDGILVDAGQGQLDATAVDEARASEPPRTDAALDSAGKDKALMPDDNLLEFGELDILEIGELQNMAATENSNRTATDMTVASHHLEAYELGDSDNVPDVCDEAMATDIGTQAPVPTILEYDMMDLDIPGGESREGDSKEAASVLYTTSQHNHPPSSLGSWQVGNWPKLDPRELLQSWTWVFRPNHQQEVL